MHTGGEPLRIITAGLPEIPGKTVLERRRFFRDNLDHIRTGLMWEPRGHADMYGVVLTPPDTPDGDPRNAPRFPFHGPRRSGRHFEPPLLPTVNGSAC